MAKKLRLARRLLIPQDAVTETFAYLAKRGAGKSYAACVTVEQMLDARLRVVILDPMGIWFGLRTAADGRSRGYEIPVLGGEHGDIPLEHTAGKLVAELVVGENVSMVLDVSLFSKRQRKHFVAEFAEELYRINRDPLHLVLEEADMFAPQKPAKGEERMLGAIEDIVRRGRQRGLGCSLITQRSAVLHKDVLTQTEVLVALRTTAPHDRKAVGDWIDAQGDPAVKKEVLDSLPSLGTGEAWFWSPGWLDRLERIQFNTKQTLDTGATPKAGGRRRALKTVADVDLGALADAMTETIERAKANDPVELRRRITELEKELTEQRAGQLTREDIDRVEEDLHKRYRTEIETIEQRVATELTAARTTVEKLGEALQHRSGQLETVGKGIDRAVAEALDNLKIPERITSTETVRFPATRTPQDAMKAAKAFVPSARPAAATKTVDGISGPQQRILDALGWLRSIKLYEPHNALVAFAARYSPKSTSYTNPRGELKTKGFVHYPKPGTVALTDKGHQALNPPDAIATQVELHRRVLDKLSGPQRRILSPLLDRYPAELSNEELAAASDYSATSTSYTNPRGELKTLGLVDYPQKGHVRAADFLFFK